MGEPRRGAPVADRFAALRFSQAVELSTVFGLSTTGNFYRKKLEEHLTGLGGVRSNAKRGVRSNADNALGGVRSNALGGCDLTWINRGIHRVSPQVGPVFDAFQGAFRW